MLNNPIAMDETTSREKVLKSIRNSLLGKTPNPFSDVDLESKIYSDLDESLALNFAQEFTNLGGKFIYCEDEEDLKAILKTFFRVKKFSLCSVMNPALKQCLPLWTFPLLIKQQILRLFIVRSLLANF